MKKLSFIITFVFLSILFVQAQQAKYVFYFIGDGMGVNQVLGTEMYRSELKGEIGITPLLFTQFPFATVATTFSATNGVTDSAAAGTALATGNKTKNGTLGMKKDLETKINSVAAWAKDKGCRVGISTSVSVDHATPAAFYAHQAQRSSYYNVGLDLIKANYDFYAGSDFLDPTNKKGGDGSSESLYTLVDKAGYSVARGYKDYQKKAKKSDKMILLQPSSATDVSAIPYAIDRKKGDMTLAEITRAGINFLSKDLSKGFFLMVEGGKIDWACHGNDPATVFEEVVDMDNAIKVAYEFYKKHPKETLIVVTADHETGGLGLGTGKYELQLKALAKQKQSQDILSRSITDLRKMRKVINWPEMKEFLAEKMGFWKELPVSWEQEKMLRDAYEESFVNKHVVFEESLYAKTEPLAVAAKKVMSQIAMVGWTSGGHTAGYVPVFAVGAGSKLFVGKMDNTEIPKRIAKAGGYK